MPRKHYHHHGNKALELKRLEPEKTSPQPDKFICKECRRVYSEAVGLSATSDTRLELVGFLVKSTGGSS